VTKKGDRYSDREKRIILECSLKEARRRLPHRTRGAILSVRYKLRRPQLRSKGGPWTAEEVARLRLYYPIEIVNKLVDRFPGRSHETIASKARRLKLRKKQLGFDGELPGLEELIDQIRIRAKQDGIPLYKLDGYSGRCRFFAKNYWRRFKVIPLQPIALAVEFFGAKLVIDWQDR
jgi:hypothetical protein